MVRDPVLPALRAATFSTVCLGLGVGAHRMMSGASVPLWAVVFSTVGVYGVARIGSGRERGLLGIGALIGALQIGLHLLFDYAQRASATEAMSALAKVMIPGICRPTGIPSATGAAMTGGMTMPPGTSMGAGAAMSMPGMNAVPGTLAGVMPPPHMSATGMILAHALAAVLSAWLLYRSEAAVHAIARSAGAWVLRFVAAPIPVVRIRIRSRLTPRIESAPQRPRPQFLRSWRLLRGPPRMVSFG